MSTNWLYHPAAATYPLSARAIEERADQLAAGNDVQLSETDVLWLLQSGGYSQSFGLWAGRHYRRERGTGCYHLRQVGQIAYLHWDEWDPRRYPLRHAFESPLLTVLTVATALLIVTPVAMIVASAWQPTGMKAGRRT